MVGNVMPAFIGSYVNKKIDRERALREARKVLTHSLQTPEFTKPEFPEPTPVLNSLPASKSEVLTRKAKKKYLSNMIASELASLNSPLKFKYLRTLNCASEIQQEGCKTKSNYCGARWCVTCNGIRTSKLMEKYGDILTSFKQPHFVTLTVRNIAPDIMNLKQYQQAMFKHFRRVQDMLRKDGITIKGVRKYEAIPDQYLTGVRPHFHWLIDGTITAQQLKNVWRKQKLPKSWKVNGVELFFTEQLQLGNLAMLKGEMLIQLWLKQHRGSVFKMRNKKCLQKPNSGHIYYQLAPFKPASIIMWDLAKREGQHVTPATPGTEKELFKYVTKVIVKSKRLGNTIPLRLIDVIYQATEHVRTIAVTGFVTVSPRVPDIVTVKEKMLADDLEQVVKTITINLHPDYSRYNKMVSVFVPQEYKKAIQLLPPESVKQLSRYKNYVRKHSDYLTYKMLSEILEELEKPIEERLESQNDWGLTDNSTTYKWHQSNWYCITSGQKLSAWQPDSLTARYVELFHYG